MGLGSGCVRSWVARCYDGGSHGELAPGGCFRPFFGEMNYGYADAHLRADCRI